MFLYLNYQFIDYIYKEVVEYLYQKQENKMKTLGIIAEYNPFHNGHLYHLQQSIEMSGADTVVCVMSGNFIQRGEPAIVNKWARTEMALSSGVDLVLELPSVYACASAEYFAFGAVKILDSLGIVDNLCFGSEHGSLEELLKIATILSNESENFKTDLKIHLDSGISFAAARQAALRNNLNTNNNPLTALESLMNSANNILGIEYLKALIKLKSNITPLTIQRKSNNYNSEELTGSISSATSIRKAIAQDLDNPLLQSVAATMPKTAFSILLDEFKKGKGPIYLEAFEKIIISEIRRKDTSVLSQIAGVCEGFENRLRKAANSSGSYSELLASLATKRYPLTRIQRNIINILSGLTQVQLDMFQKHGGPQYVKVLGFNDKGRNVLARMKETCTLPVIMKASNYKKSCNPLLTQMLYLDNLLTDLYVLAYENPIDRKAGSEFTQKILLHI